MHALIFFMISFSFKTREDEDEDNLLEKRRRSSSSSFSYSSSSSPSALHARGIGFMYVPASAAKNLLECQEGVLLLAEKPRNTRIPESEEEAGGDDDDDDDDEGSEEDVATARTVAAIPEPRVREISPEGRRRMCRAPLLAAAISSSTRRKEKLRVKSGQKRRFFSCMTPHSQAA
jgi:hypothetical protein